MTIATGFAAIRAFQIGTFIQKEGADYKNRASMSKAKRRQTAVNLARLLGKRAPPRFLSMMFSENRTHFSASCSTR
jgi:hypothetical protein